MDSLHGFPARRKFIDDRHVQVTVQGHGKGPRNGGSRHDQYMRRHPARRFPPQFRPLFHSEAVLLVYDGQTEIPEQDIVLYKGMSPHYYAYAPVFQTGMDFTSLRSPAASCEQGHSYTGGLQIF